VILRAQVALHPDEVDGLLRLRHAVANNGMRSVKHEGGRLAGALFLMLIVFVLR